MEVATWTCFCIGLFVNAMSVVGMMRFPDVYTRLHAATKTSTFGAIFLVAGVVLNSIEKADSTSTTIIIHSVIALAVIIFTNPISAHAIARASLIFGIKPSGAVVNEYAEKRKEIRSAQR